MPAAAPTLLFDTDRIADFVAPISLAISTLSSAGEPGVTGMPAS